MFRAVALIVVLFTTWESIKAQGLRQAGVPPWEKKTPVWGRVTRVEGMFAEFSLNRQSGLWKGDTVRVFRRIEGARKLVIPKNPLELPHYVQTEATTVELGTMSVGIVDDKQAVGKANGHLPAVGDYVLFQKPVPRADDPENPFNKFIGSYADITLYDFSRDAPPNGVLAPRRGLILDLKTATLQDIRTITVAFPSIPVDDDNLADFRVALSANACAFYDAGEINRIRIGATDYVYDSTYNTLAQAGVVASRGHSSTRPAVNPASKRGDIPLIPYIASSSHKNKRKSPSPAPYPLAPYPVPRGSSSAPDISPEFKALLGGVALIAALKLAEQMTSNHGDDSTHSTSHPYDRKSYSHFPFTYEDEEIMKRALRLPLTGGNGR
jgi:hypothetical protein